MTRYRNRNRNTFQNTFKDYLVPIVWWALLLLLLFSLFNGDESDTSTTNSSNENRIPVDISFIDIDTEAHIVYPWEVKEKITDSASLYKWERIIVKEGALDLSFDSGTQISLNKTAELKYNEDGSFWLYSSDAWVSLWENTNITMKYANVSAPAGTVMSLAQNEASSTIYLLSWSAKVSNSVWVSTSLTKWQKISILKQNASNSDIDLASEKWNIGSYFKGSDWFIDNKWFEILNKQDQVESGTGNTAESIWSSGIYLSFDNLRDEMSVSSNTLDISWKILSENVWTISINNRQASISGDKKIFSFSALPLWNSVNDVVIKIYDTDKNILEKKVITVYNSGWSSSNISSNVVQTTSSTNSQGITTFWVDGTDFGFTSPSVTGKFATTGSEITIRWVTTAEGISKVEVNGFKLASFNGSTWRYHAFERFETLEEGTNQYKVNYFWEDGKLVYTDYYTIVKKAASSVTTTPAEVEEEVISDEVETNTTQDQ